VSRREVNIPPPPRSILGGVLPLPDVLATSCCNSTVHTSDLTSQIGFPGRANFWQKCSTSRGVLGPVRQAAGISRGHVSSSTLRGTSSSFTNASCRVGAAMTRHRLDLLRCRRPLEASSWRRSTVFHLQRQRMSPIAPRNSGTRVRLLEPPHPLSRRPPGYLPHSATHPSSTHPEVRVRAEQLASSSVSAARRSSPARPPRPDGRSPAWSAPARLFLPGPGFNRG